MKASVILWHLSRNRKEGTGPSHEVFWGKSIPGGVSRCGGTEAERAWWLWGTARSPGWLEGSRQAALQDERVLPRNVLGSPQPSLSGSHKLLPTPKLSASRWVGRGADGGSFESPTKLPPPNIGSVLLGIDLQMAIPGQLPKWLARPSAAPGCGVTLQIHVPHSLKDWAASSRISLQDNIPGSILVNLTSIIRFGFVCFFWRSRK